MGMLESLKGAIWEQQSPMTPAAPGTPQPAARPAVASIPSANGEMVETIRKATLTRKTPFTALVEAADKLVSVIPDTTTRLKAAYAMIGDQRSIVQIQQAIDVHIADVDGEKMRFKQASDKKRSTEIASIKTQADALTGQVNNLQTEVKGLMERIQALNEQITTSTQKAAELSAESTRKEQEIVLVEQQFDLAAQTVKGELEQYRATIISTLS